MIEEKQEESVENNNNEAKVVEEENEEERLEKTAKYDDSGKITAGTLTTLVEHVTYTSGILYT